MTKQRILITSSVLNSSFRYTKDEAKDNATIYAYILLPRAKQNNKVSARFGGILIEFIAGLKTVN